MNSDLDVGRQVHYRPGLVIVLDPQVKRTDREVIPWELVFLKQSMEDPGLDYVNLCSCRFCKIASLQSIVCITQPVQVKVIKTLQITKPQKYDGKCDNKGLSRLKFINMTCQACCPVRVCSSVTECTTTHGNINDLLMQIIQEYNRKQNRF